MYLPAYTCPPAVRQALSTCCRENVFPNTRPHPSTTLVQLWHSGTHPSRHWDWLLWNSIKCSRLPLAPVSNISLDVLNLLKNISDGPWWKGNPRSRHLSVLIILFQISVERHKAASNRSFLYSLLMEAALKAIRNIMRKNNSCINSNM